MRRTPSSSMAGRSATRAGHGGAVDLGPQRRARRREQQLELGEALEGERGSSARGWPGGRTSTRSSSKSWAAMISSPLRGKVTTARSSWPEASCCSSWTLEPSATLRWMWGWRTRSRSKSWGTSQRPGGADHAEADGADDLLAQGGDVGHHGLELVHDPAGPLDDDLALLGEAARGPVDQLHVELALEPGHVGRDVGLDGADGGGGGREAAGVGDAQECLQVFQFHGSTSPGSACRSVVTHQYN